VINFFKISSIIQKIDVILPLQSIGVVFYFLNFSTSKLNYTRYVAAAAIFQLVVIDIIIDLLLIYLTRGRNLVGKIKKISKMVRNGKAMLKKLDDAGVELIPPCRLVFTLFKHKRYLLGKNKS